MELLKSIKLWHNNKQVEVPFKPFISAKIKNKLEAIIPSF